MKRMTLSEYLAVPEDYRGVWTTELPIGRPEEKATWENVP